MFGVIFELCHKMNFSAKHEDLTEIFGRLDQKETGFVSVDVLYEVMAKIYHPGLTFEDFNQLVKNCNIAIPRCLVYSADLC